MVSADQPILISLGSNIEPESNLRRAAERLDDQLEILATSQVFATRPIGGSKTAPFLNAALAVACDLTPGRLKSEILRPLESQLGRVRTADRNAPRTIDLDISLFGSEIVEDVAGGLVIPDPEILTRIHVALPLADVAPDVVHPVTRERLQEIAARLQVGDEIRICPGLTLWP